ncbi:MAG TPA: class I SAM-dependent methyltransferase [Dehalococcoidia bacterium]|nr:class I SAM-dependent methyltransferase [Dehalococcoidia bacterium]
MTKYGSYEYIEFVADCYDATYEARSPRDLEFFIDYSRKTGGRTLELGCGTGRVLIPTAAAGCDITGLDFSSYMLSKCRDKLDQQPQEVQQRVRLIQGDMTNFDTGEVYSLITIPFRPFQHLVTVAEQRACLACIHRHLSPKGILVFDVFNPDFRLLIAGPEHGAEQESHPATQLPDGRTFRRTARFAGFHRAEQYNDIELIYYITSSDGKTERLVQAFPMRYFFRYEIEHLLELSSFKVVDLFGDFEKSTFSDDSPEMIFIAEKIG